MPEEKQKVQIGRVIKPHGVRGEFVVEPTTDIPDERFAVGQVLSGTHTGKQVTLTIRTMRHHQNRLLLTCDEIPDRNAADSLRGIRFYADPIANNDDAYYDYELEGLRVLHCGNVDADTAYRRAYDGESPEPADIGKIISVRRTPAGRLLCVHINDDADLPTAGGHVLIPFHYAIVPIVDCDNNMIVITPPDGLLEL